MDVKEHGSERSFFELSRFRQTAVRAWVHIGLLLPLLLWLCGDRFVPSGDSLRDGVMRPRVDFMAFYASALLFRESPKDLYNVVKEAAAESKATGLQISTNDLDFLPFPYPAIVAVAFVPFTLFAYHTAYFAVMFLNLILIGVDLWLLSNQFQLGAYQNKILVLCAFALLPVYACLLHGQVSFVILLLCILAVSDLRQKRDRAGLWVGLLAFKPTVIPVWLFWLVVRRRWRALLYALTVSGGMAILSVLLAGIEGTVGYIRLLQRMLQGNFLVALPQDMPTLRSLTHYFGLPFFVWAIAVSSVLLALWMTRSSTDWEYCSVVFGCFLIAPHLQLQEMVLLLIPITIALSIFRDNYSAFFRWSLLGVVLWVCLVRGLTGGTNGNHWPLMPATTIVLFIWCLYMGNRVQHLGTGRPSSVDGLGLIPSTPRTGGEL